MKLLLWIKINQIKESEVSSSIFFTYIKDTIGLRAMAQISRLHVPMYPALEELGCTIERRKYPVYHKDSGYVDTIIHLPKTQENK